jgi:rSAM/selenodomain-associated transferase 2
VQEAGQVLVVDGGSRDGSVAAARAVPGVQVLEGAAPRAGQMNQGAAAAVGQALLFLHADAILPPQFARLIHQALADPAVAGGAFALALDDSRLRARVVSRGANLRTRLTGHPYGDQALFVRRDLFQEMGGFMPWPYLEDLEFARRLRRRGRLCLLPQAVTVSARRWRAQGYLRTTWRNTVLATWFYLGLDARRFSHWLAPYREG